MKRGRLTKEEVSVEDTILMDNLHLIDEDLKKNPGYNGAYSYEEFMRIVKEL